MKTLFALIAVSALGFATASPAQSAPQGAQVAAAGSKVTIPVEGLGCASCSLTVRHALKKLDGVKSIAPGAHENEAVVTYDAKRVNPDQMVEAINKLGFKAGMPTKG